MIERIRPHVTHVAVAFSVVSLVAFSGPMSAITRENTTRVVAQTSGQSASAVTTTSAYVAANVASGLSIGLASQVTDHSEDLNSRSQLLASDSAYMRKASTVATDSVSSEDIRTYTVKSGETVSDIARKFGITSDTIRWANDLTANTAVNAGDKLTILPVNGVLHTVKSGDTPEKLAEHYKANAALIISFNDAEVNGLKAGQKIVIPDGEKPAPANQFNASTSSFASSFVPSYGGGNGYAYGWCTWYVANRIDVPNNWGNANTWGVRAAASGWTVSATPTVGAIAQRAGGWGGLGHVAIVEEVNGNQVRISDMNGFAGWGQVGTGWVSVGEYQYITR